MIDRTMISSPVGLIVVFARASACVAVGFEQQESSLRARLGDEEIRDAATSIPASAIERYVAGDLHALDTLSVDARGTDFQKGVWAALRKIAPGETVSYAELAGRLGAPSSVRAVAQANARNPVSLVVPCHRVIGKNGKLTGYAGGIERKAWLLRHEGAAHVSSQ